MVSNITSLTGNGLKDWLIQRVTAVYFAVYVLFLFAFFMLNQPLHYEIWSSLFHNGWFQIASAIALLTLSLHAWVGIWTVTTDYVQATWLRVSMQCLVAFFLLAQFVWGFMIIWGQA